MLTTEKIYHIGKLRALLLIPGLMVFSGCQKVINVDLNDASPRIVIEGLITDRKGPYTVTISKTASYFNQPVIPPVTDALVIITDNVGTIDTLKERQPGIYFTSRIHGVSGRKYTLRVLSEGMEYAGTTTMNSHVSINSLNLLKSQPHNFDFGSDNRDEMSFDIYCYFSDPTEKNYYRIKFFRNDTTRNENYRLYDDQYTNGQEVALRVGHATAGDTDRIELYSLDKSTYGYYSTLEDLIYTNPVFGSTPANPNTNLDNGALGYFGACTVSTKVIIITDSLLQTVKY